MFGTSSDWIFRAEWNLKRNSWVQSIHLEVNSPADGDEPLCGLLLDFHSLLPLESWPWGTPSHVKLFFLLMGAEPGWQAGLPPSPSFLPLTCQVALLAAPPPGDSELTGPLKQETWLGEADKPSLFPRSLSPPQPAPPAFQIPASAGASGLPITADSQAGRIPPSTEALGRHSSLAFSEQRFSHLSALQGGQRRLIRACSHLVASFIIADYGKHWQTWLSCLGRMSPKADPKANHRQDGFGE